jgi:hypothetical protein
MHLNPYLLQIKYTKPDLVMTKQNNKSVKLESLTAIGLVSMSKTALCKSPQSEYSILFYQLSR